MDKNTKMILGVLALGAGYLAYKKLKSVQTVQVNTLDSALPSGSVSNSSGLNAGEMIAGMRGMGWRR